MYRFKLPNDGVGHEQQGDRFGVGKTTVEFEISDVLGELGVPNAAVDLDSIIVKWPWTSRWPSDLVFQNLTSLWPNYLLEDAGDLDRYRHAVPGAAIMVIRLVAPEGMRVSHLTARIPGGPSREWHVARTVELEEVLERAGYEDFVVDNGDRPVREVALEILQRAQWI